MSAPQIVSFEKWLAENRPEKCTRHEVALAERAFSAGTESVRDERLALVLPSEDDAFAWARNYYNERGAFPSPKSVYLWLRANVKAVVVPDPRFAIPSMESLLKLGEIKKNGVASFQHGYMTALKMLRGEG